MILATKLIIPPKEWIHSPTIQNKNNITTAMFLADKGIIPPKEWTHRPEL